MKGIERKTNGQTDGPTEASAYCYLLCRGILTLSHFQLVLKGLYIQIACSQRKISIVAVLEKMYSLDQDSNLGIPAYCVDRVY